jgi:hypothetical protein
MRYTAITLAITLHANMTDLYRAGYEWINHSLRPVPIDDFDFRVRIGGAQSFKQRNPVGRQSLQVSQVRRTPEQSQRARCVGILLAARDQQEFRSATRRPVEREHAVKELRREGVRA